MGRKSYPRKKEAPEKITAKDLINSKSVDMLILGGKKQSVPKFVKGLNDPDVKVRKESLYHLSLLNDERSLLPILEVFKDNDQPEEVRLAAGSSLGYLKCGGVIEELVKCLESRDDFVLQWAIYALGTQKDPKALPELLRIMKGAPVSVSLMILDSIGKIGNRDSAEALVCFLKTADEKLKDMILFTIGELNNRKTAPALHEYLKDGSEAIRYRTLEVLEKMNDSTSVPAVSELLNDPVPHIRVKAMEVIGKIKKQII